jgi:hypothetical protein
MLNPNRLDADRAMLLVIDVQTKLLPLIEGHEEVVAGIRQLLRGAELFDLPRLAGAGHRAIPQGHRADRGSRG